jgi:hypothetical protein
MDTATAVGNRVVKSVDHNALGIPVSLRYVAGSSTSFPCPAVKHDLLVLFGFLESVRRLEHIRAEMESAGENR